MDELIEDVKLLDEENDLYGTCDKVSAIKEFLELDENKHLLAKNNLIAIYGEWGSGKSCLMNTLKENIDSNKFNTIWFNTWKYEKDDNLAYSLYKYIICNMKNDVSKKIIESLNILNKSIWSLFKSISRGTTINFEVLSFDGNEIMNAAKEYDKEIEDTYYNKDCLWKQIEQFENLFKKIKFKKNKRLIVFLDDLDRCESENIIKLISAIKLLLSLNENIIFILGIDKNAVTLALKNKYNNDSNKAEEYLEKIFPINFQINNEIDNDNFFNYMKNIFNQDNELTQYIYKFINLINFNNPRHIKKVFRKYLIIKKYLIKKNIDLTKKNNLLITIYMIILNYYYNDEYTALVSNDKKNYYNNIICIYDDKQYRKPFNTLNNLCEYSFYNEETEMVEYYDINEIIVKFSSYKLIKTEIFSNYNGLYNIFYFSDWKMMVKNNICNYFIQYILNDIDYFEDKLEPIAVNQIIYDKIKIHEFYSIINTINRIM